MKTVEQEDLEFLKSLPIILTTNFEKLAQRWISSRERAEAFEKFFKARGWTYNQVRDHVQEKFKTSHIMSLSYENWLSLLKDIRWM